MDDGEFGLSTTFAQVIAVGALALVTAGPVAYSLPPQYHYDLHFNISHVVRAPTELHLHEGSTLDGHFIWRDMEPHNWVIGTQYAFAAQIDEHGVMVTTIYPSESPEGHSIIDGASNHIGWDHGCPFRASREWMPVPECVEVKWEPVHVPPRPLANGTIPDWQNDPDGDGEFIITLRNTGAEPVEVPVYDTTPADWVLVGVQDKIFTLRGEQSETGSLPAPLTLNPGQVYEKTVNVLLINETPDYMPDWPRGGYRIPIRAIIGDRILFHSFYYYTNIHDPIRGATDA